MISLHKYSLCGPSDETTTFILLSLQLKDSEQEMGKKVWDLTRGEHCYKYLNMLDLTSVLCLKAIMAPCLSVHRSFFRPVSLHFYPKLTSILFPTRLKII